MPEPFRSVVISLATMVIIAVGTLVWKILLRSIVLDLIQPSPNLKGEWQATWPYGHDSLVIERQAGKWLYGSWTLHFAAPKKYRFEGQYIGETIVGYLVPARETDIGPASLALRVKGDNELVGKVLGVETDPEKRKNDELYVALNNWNRIS